MGSPSPGNLPRCTRPPSKGCREGKTEQTDGRSLSQSPEVGFPP